MKLHNRLKKAYTALLFLVLSLNSTHLMAGSATEDELKTAYMFNFARFVQWPEEKNQPKFFKFCIYPNNRFGELFLQLEQLQIGEKKIQVSELSSIRSIQQCHAVFIDSLPKKDLSRAMLIAKEHHVLTISDQNNFSDNGGMIHMFIKNGKIRFNINYDSSSDAKLTISSKLMSLASNIIRKTL